MSFLTKSQLISIGFKNIGNNIFISDKCSIYNPKNISIGSNVRIDDFCILSAGEGGIELHDYIHIACHSILIGAEKITIESFSTLSSRVAIYSSSDDFSGEFLISPMSPKEYTNVISKQVIIKKHVLVGSTCVILPGVTINEGAAIGAMSLVNSNCEPYCIYAGSPVVKIKARSRNIFELEHKLLEKMTYKTEVDICILSNAKTDQLRSVTENGIKTLLASEENIKFNVFVVEGNENVKYDFPNTKTLNTWKDFNYNAYMNFAIKQGKAPYVVLCNNDLTYEKNWATNIIKEMKANPQILSASPFCPGVNVMNGSNTHIGYTVRKELNGWCIFTKRELFDKIGSLNEEVNFWFSDNIYGDQLAFHGIKHALVQNSVVHHHDQNLGVTGDTLEFEKKLQYTNGQYTNYLQAKIKYIK